MKNSDFNSIVNIHNPTVFAKLFEILQVPSGIYLEPRKKCFPIIGESISLIIFGQCFKEHCQPNEKQ